MTLFILAFPLYKIILGSYDNVRACPHVARANAPARNYITLVRPNTAISLHVF